MRSGSRPTAACLVLSPRRKRSSTWVFPHAWWNGSARNCRSIRDRLAGRCNSARPCAGGLVGALAGLGDHWAGGRWSGGGADRPPSAAARCGPGRAGPRSGTWRPPRRLAATLAAGARRCVADGHRNRRGRRTGTAANAAGRGGCPWAGAGAASSRGAVAGLRAPRAGVAQRAGGGQRRIFAVAPSRYERPSRAYRLVGGGRSTMHRSP